MFDKLKEITNNTKRSFVGAMSIAKMNNKGGMLNAILQAFVGLVLLVALVPVISTLTTSAINEVNNGDDISNKPVIIILLGLVVLMIVVAMIYGIITEMQRPNNPQY